MSTEDIRALIKDLEGEGGALGRVVFGEPVERDGLTVIPLARLVVREGTAHRAKGRSVVVEPVGYLEIREGEVEFEPVVPPNSPAGIMSLLPALAEVWEKVRRKK